MRSEEESTKDPKRRKSAQEKAHGLSDKFEGVGDFHSIISEGIEGVMFLIENVDIVRIRAMVAHMQIAINVGFNCVIEFPPIFEDVAALFSMVNLDLVPSLGLSCRFNSFDYTDKMLMVTLVPLAFVGILGLAYTVVSARSGTANEAFSMEDLERKHVVRAEFADSFSASEIKNLRIIFAASDDAENHSCANRAKILALIHNFDPEEQGLSMGHFEGNGIMTFPQFLDAARNYHGKGRQNGLESFASKVNGAFSKRTKSQASIVGIFLLWTFIVLVGVSTVLFYFFKCDIFDVPTTDGGGAQAFMYKDYSVDCTTDKYAFFGFYAAMMIIVFPVGIPALYASMLWRHRALFDDMEALSREEVLGNPTIGHLSFLVASYRAECYWFEVVECFRRLLLACIVGIVSANSAVAPIFGLLICYIFILVFDVVRPYKTSSQNWVGVALQYSLTLLFTAALMIKLDESGAAVKDDAHDQRIFGYILVLILFAGPIVAVLQLAVMATKLRSKLRKENKDQEKELEMQQANCPDGTMILTTGEGRGEKSYGDGEDDEDDEVAAALAAAEAELAEAIADAEVEMRSGSEAAGSKLQKRKAESQARRGTKGVTL